MQRNASKNIYAGLAAEIGGRIDRASATMRVPKMAKEALPNARPKQPGEVDLTVGSHKAIGALSISPAPNASGEDHRSRVGDHPSDHPSPVNPARVPQSVSDGDAKIAISIDQTRAANPSLAETVAIIKAWNLKRRYYLKLRTRNMNALGAAIRTRLGWSLQIPETERKKIATKAAAVIKSGGEGTPWEDEIRLTLMVCEPLVEAEDQCVAEMEKAAVQLPAWASFGKDVRGFGPKSLACIVAEAGDLSNYPDKSKLWKRMGVAVIGDVRQGKASSAEEYIVHGYKPSRRSELWQIGDSLIKGNKDGKYRAAYLSRKAYEATRDPGMSKMHAHRRAQRYMEKMLLRDLRSAWVGETPALFRSGESSGPSRSP